MTKFQSPLFATITSMRKFADFTLYILKCRVVPSCIHLVMSAMFIWTYSYVSYSMQLFKYFFASSACVTLSEAWILELSISIFLRTSMKIELILAKSACFTTPVNIQEMTICPLHRERLGIGWRRSIIDNVVFPRNYRDMMTQQSKKQSEAVRCYSRSLYYKP